MVMSNKTYDILNWITQIFLPALGTLYAALAVVWGFPYGEQVVSSIIALDTFFGAILSYSKSKYDKANAKTKKLTKK